MVCAPGAVEINCAAGNRVRVGAGSERSRNTDRAAAGQRARTGGTTRQVVVVESRNGLRTGAVEIDCAAGNRVRVSAGSERARNTDRAAVCQCARTGGTAGQIVVVEGGMVCAPAPLKSIVLPVIVYELVPGVNVPAMPIVPLLASVRAPEELLVRLL